MVELATVEPHENNPFWRASQAEPGRYKEYMLRSQIFFLLSNITADIRTRLDSGMNISDTSTLTDVLMWVEWYHQTGRFSDEEYQAYQNLVTLLRPIIPKPDLMVLLVPDSVDHLKEGIVERQRNEPARAGELIFTWVENQDLTIQVKLMEQVEQKISDEWQIPIIRFKVDPRLVYSDPNICFDMVRQIRDRLPLK